MTDPIRLAEEALEHYEHVMTTTAPFNGTYIKLLAHALLDAHEERERLTVAVQDYKYLEDLKLVEQRERIEELEGALRSAEMSIDCTLDYLWLGRDDEPLDPENSPGDALIKELEDLHKEILAALSSPTPERHEEGENK